MITHLKKTTLTGLSVLIFSSSALGTFTGIDVLLVTSFKSGAFYSNPKEPPKPWQSSNFDINTHTSIDCSEHPQQAIVECPKKGQAKRSYHHSKPKKKVHDYILQNLRKQALSIA